MIVAFFQNTQAALRATWAAWDGRYGGCCCGRLQAYQQEARVFFHADRLDGLNASVFDDGFYGLQHGCSRLRITKVALPNLTQLRQLLHCPMQPMGSGREGCKSLSSWRGKQVFPLRDHLRPGERAPGRVGKQAGGEHGSSGHQRRQEQQPGRLTPTARLDAFAGPRRRRGAKPGAVKDVQEVGRVEQARSPQHPDCPLHSHSRCAIGEPGFAHRACGQWRAHHAQRGDAERQRGQRHAPLISLTLWMPSVSA